MTALWLKRRTLREECTELVRGHADILYNTDGVVKSTEYLINVIQSMTGFMSMPELQEWKTRMAEEFSKEKSHA